MKATYPPIKRGMIEAVLRRFLTGDGFIAECDIQHIVAALTAALAQQPAAPSGAALGDLGMQDDTMKYDPATGEQRPYPSHAEQWRRWHGLECAWLFDPWTGRRRNALDVGSDINGRLIVPAGTLGGDMNCGAPMQNCTSARN
jgi:hypothetical protein